MINVLLDAVNQENWSYKKPNSIKYFQFTDSVIDSVINHLQGDRFRVYIWRVSMPQMWGYLDKKTVVEWWRKSSLTSWHGQLMFSCRGGIPTEHVFSLKPGCISVCRSRLDNSNSLFSGDPCLSNEMSCFVFSWIFYCYIAHKGWFWAGNKKR